MNGYGAPIYQMRNNISSITPGNATRVNIGAVKFSEGQSAIPRDRIFMHYNYFDNTNLGAGGVNVSRFTPGFEKTFNDGNSSIQMRFPFASTLDNDFMTNGITNTSSVLFGDIQMVLKTVLMQRKNTLISTGLQWTLPTADDLTFNATQGGTGVVSEFARVHTDSVHILPYISSLYTRGDRFWVQSYLQLDFDANGNPVTLNESPFKVQGAAVLPNAPGASQIGVWNEATYLYADMSFGYQVYRNLAGGPTGLTTFSPMLELHYNRSITDSDSVSKVSKGITVAEFGRPGVNVEVVNLTIGTTFNWRDGSNVMLGYVTPISGGSDKEFDGELRVMLTKRFGGNNQDDITAARNRRR